MTARLEMMRYLRDRIIGELHTGRLKGGDRLPSVRDIAAILDRNPRTVRAAYRALEAEGLVTVRGRSGVFVAVHQPSEDGTSKELARWMATVITEGWKRRIAVPVLAQAFERYTRSRLRCVFVEEVEDAKVSLGDELKNEWGCQVHVVSPGELARSAAQFRDFDFIATTSFYASAIHNEVEAIGLPLIVLTVHTAIQDAVQERLRKGRLVVVAVDPRFGDRLRIAYDVRADLVRVVLADDVIAVRRLDPSEPVLCTRAARQRLGTIRPPLIYSHSPTLSAETAHALAGLVVRKNSHVGKARDK